MSVGGARRRVTVSVICGLALVVAGLAGASPASAAAPTATTQAATSIVNDGATLNGTVNPGGEVTAYTFEYGTTLSFGNITTIAFTDNGSAAAPVSAPVSGLQPNTTYFFRLVATNGTATSTGAVMAFTTSGPPTPPAVTTGSASPIGAYQATLGGTVNPEGLQTAFTFEYGTTATFGHITAVDNAGSAGVVQPVTLPVTGLAPQTTYNYRLVATNSAGTTWGPTLQFTSAADQGAPTDLALSNSSVAENQPSGTAVGTLSSTDPDPGDPVTFSLVSGTGSTDNGSFQISGNTLQTAASFDFETKSSYSIRVRATDGANLTFEKQLTVTVTDVVENRPPTDITLSNSSVAENQATGTTVGTLSAVDPDAGDTASFSLVSGTGSTDNTSFTITGNTLKTNAVFDFETKSSYSIRVRATDSGNATFEKVFTITVTNVNEAPTDISLSKANIDENLPSGTTVGTLSATDPDAGDTHTFSLVSGTGSTDNASFTISGSSLKSAVSFNFEVKSSYSIRVRATDAGNLTFEKQFTITINNVNDPPVAGSDTYSGAIGNTKATRGVTVSGEPVVALTGNVLTANDTDEDGNTLSTVAETVSSTGGGSATMTTAGTFTYVPGVGDKNQSDTFTYHVTDGTATSAGTVTINISNAIVWYVDRDAATNGDGRSNTPLNNLAGINGAGGAGDADGSGDTIFLYSSATPYTGGLPLETNQQLIGEPQGLTVNSVNLVPAAGTNPVIQNSAGTAITLANGITTRRVSVGTTTGDGIAGTSITTADIGGTSTVSGVSGADFKLSGAASGDISFGPAITNTAGRSVDIQNRTGGTVTLSGAIADTGTGVFLNSNTGATVNFTGQLNASTGTSPAFTATGGGTVSSSNTASTLATTTGTALNVASTTIGSAGLKFTSIASNGAASGIILNTTGTTAGLTVSGTGAANSGGTIANATGTAGAIALTNTDKVSLNNMSVTGSDHSSIVGTGVTDFTFTNGSVTNAGDTKTNNLDGSFAFNSNPAGATNNLDGAVTITGNTITNSYGASIDITNRAGTISDANVSNNTITTATSAADSKEEGIIFDLQGTASTVASLTKATIQNNSVTNVPSGGGIVLTAGNPGSSTAPIGTYGTPGSTNVVTITGNHVQGPAGVNMGGQGISAGIAGRGQANVAITNNGTAASPLTNLAGLGVGVGAAGDVTATFVVTGNVMAPNNEFNSPGIGVTEDKNIQGDAVTLTHPLINATVSSNTISNTNGAGIRVLSINSNGTLNLKLQNNSVGAPSGSFAGIRVENGSSSDASFNPTMCATMSGNTAGRGPVDGFGDAPPGMELFKRSTSSTTYVFGITGLSPSPATAAQTETYVFGQNPNSALGAGFFAGKHVAVAAGDQFTSCTLPF